MRDDFVIVDVNTYKMIAAAIVSLGLERGREGIHPWENLISPA